MKIERTKITIALLFVLVFIVSCKSNLSKSQSAANNQITISLTECGSYEVKNNLVTIGYCVKPFYIEIDRIKEIAEFERKLKIKYKNKFNKDYRIYTPTLNRAEDTILMTLLFSPKQIENNPSWKCEEQGVDTYHKDYMLVVYNCSKNRFRIPSDPD